MRSIFTACLMFASTIAWAAPPDSTFRWSLAKLDCGHGLEVRSTVASCVGRDPQQQQRFLVVGYRGTASNPKLSVIRYDGETAAAPQRWLVDFDAGAGAGEPVVATFGPMVAVGVIANGAVKLTMLAASDGRRGAAATILASGAANIQLEGTATALRVHVLKTDRSGEVIVVDPSSLKILAAHRVAASSIRTTQERTAIPANGEAQVAGIGFVAKWENASLVVRSGSGRATKIVDDDKFRRQLVTMHAKGDRVLVTLHHQNASGAGVFAFDAKIGAEVSRRRATGIGVVVHSGYYNKVSSLVAGDELVVQGVEAGGAYVCTFAIADGRERACVDHLPAAAIFDPGPPTVTVKAMPSGPVGPVTMSMSCNRTPTAKSSLTLRPWSSGPIAGTIVSPSATCKPKLYGGIAGDRIELDVFDRPAGASVCECTIEFRQDTNKDSRVVLVKHGGVELGRASIRP